MNYYLNKREEIITYHENNIGVPEYNYKIWKHLKNVNCYAYILDIPVDDPLKLIWFPGCISREDIDVHIFSIPELLERTYSDLEFLNIILREDNGVLNDNEYRIAIYTFWKGFDYPIGFHFSRQDKDGRWSQKKNWTDRVRRINNKSDIPISMEKYNVQLEKSLILKKNKTLVY